MNSLLDDNNYKKLEKEYPFLSRAREALGEKPSPLENDAYVIFDLETTGLEPTTCEIIEIGAVKIENKEIKEIFNTLVFPLSPIPPHIEKITGISNEMVTGYPGIKNALNDFMQFIGNHILVAHNADFDVSFVKQHLKMEFDRELTNPSICTLQLARFLLPKLVNHKLHTIAHYFKIETPVRHRALGDCEITYQVWLKLLNLLKKKNILSQADLIQNGLIC
ncbi:MAG: 3'-5' exonuclease [Candidatus Margulisbacteria bacterium]|nr:3'-5' exonuclease [Candidatus Margulisiibacteriota bacterium]MBU1021564.1 3'-5' exonuclease [Candidatus Margulisiibacteriota bacterium]MBU1728715.1 3'-5' exonuclease [Candidatus Margulisiibacteriota bacterium]MBU1955166.1 3'-5' exonuclease [Candidatus Margulisiibacteriota bacterium]